MPSCPHGGFTLIEVLVVVSIIALLAAMLMPSLARARAQAMAIKCKANLRQIGAGLVIYTQVNRDYIVPSYNLPWLPGASSNTSGGPNQPLDGWGPILDRDRLVPATSRDSNAAFYCPQTSDLEGLKDGATGSDPEKPRGWADWPLKFTSTGSDTQPKIPVTIPQRGFRKIIRVSYWLNAYNPIGSTPPDISATDVYYTASAGFGPDAKGQFIAPHKLRSSRASHLRFIASTDGVFMGRQSVTQLGNTNSLIGYRHPGAAATDPIANAVLADGHVEGIARTRFPRARSASDSSEVTAQKKHENLSGPTVYANPRQMFP